MSARCGLLGSGGDVRPSRYTRFAVPLKIAFFSAADAPAVRRLNMFHSAGMPMPIFSTG